MAKNSHSEFFLTIFPKMTGTNSKCQKMGILNYFLKIFPEKTGINSKWPKMVVSNFFQQFSQKHWSKFGIAKDRCSNFSDNFSQKNY